MNQKHVSRIVLNGAILFATVSVLTLAGCAPLTGDSTRGYRSSALGQQSQKVSQARQLPEECYDEFRQIIITPENVELCSEQPTAAIASLETELESDPGSGPGPGPGPGPDPDPDPDPEPEPDSEPESDDKDNKGHGNGNEGDQQGSEGSDSDNPGNGPKN